MKIDKKAVDEWLTTYWSGDRRNCPVCGCHDWKPFDYVWECREFQGGILAAGGIVLPLVAVMCNVCGHTLLFNAYAVKAIKRPKGEEE